MPSGSSHYPATTDVPVAAPVVMRQKKRRRVAGARFELRDPRVMSPVASTRLTENSEYADFSSPPRYNCRTKSIYYKVLIIKKIMHSERKIFMGYF